MFIWDFRSQFRVHQVDGAVIPPFKAPLVTKLYKLIHLSIKNLLNFIVIQQGKHASKYMAISSSLSVTMALTSISYAFVSV